MGSPGSVTGARYRGGGVQPAAKWHRAHPRRPRDWNPGTRPKPREAVMRVAVLADIHGNLPALDAVLADAEAAGANAIVLNGDMATGPMPAQTLERLAGLGERAVWVRGNCERELADAWDGTLDPGLPEQARVPAEYCASHLEPAH